MISSGLYSNKNILVTGSSRGVGRFIAEYFLNHGATVFGLSRGNSTIEHPKYTHFEVDIGDATSVQFVFSSIRRKSNFIDILINNAAVAASQYALILSPVSAQEMINTNFFGTFMISREGAKLMRKKKWGRIINISSMMASLEPVGGSIYAASKTAMTTMGNIFAKELAPLGITCNTLAISAIPTEMMHDVPSGTISDYISSLPIPRYAQPDDIFNVLDFLSSDRSGYITAQTIYLGGVN